MEERNLRKVMIGTVLSNKMDKTVVVAVQKNARADGTCKSNCSESGSRKSRC